MNWFEKALAYRQQLLDHADAQAAEINAKYFPKMGDVVGTAEGLGGLTSGMTRAVKKYGPITGKFIDKYGPHFSDTGKMEFPLDKEQILTHFRQQFPIAKKQWPKGKDTWSNTYGSQMVDRYNKAVQFLKEKGYLPAGQEGYFKGIGDEFEIPKGMKTESVFSKLAPREGSRTVEAMEKIRLDNPYISDSLAEDYLEGLTTATKKVDNEFLTDKLPKDVYNKFLSDRFLKKGD